MDDNTATVILVAIICATWVAIAWLKNRKSRTPTPAQRARERAHRHAMPDPTHITHQQLLDAHTALGLSTKGGQETVIARDEVRYTRSVKGPDGVTLIDPDTGEFARETIVIPIAEEAP